MSSSELRAQVVDTFLRAGVKALTRGDLGALFVRGELNPLLSELYLDSLALIEVCIGIENSFGVSLSPDQLVKLPTLESVVARIEAG